MERRVLVEVVVEGGCQGEVVEGVSKGVCEGAVKEGCEGMLRRGSCEGRVVKGNNWFVSTKRAKSMKK